jgi:cytochrome b561
MASSPAPTLQPERYHGAAIVLHWTLAALLVFQFALGLRLDTIAARGAKYTAFQFHESIGISILLLSFARLGLRLTLRRPAELGAGLQKLAAQLVHWAFYAVMILAPLSGWIIVSTAKLKVPTLLFGLVLWPNLPLPALFHEPAALAHTVLGWSLPPLIALHVAAVIYHLRQRSAVPDRMVHAALPTAVGLASGVVLLALSGWLGTGGPIPDLWSKRPVAAISISPPPLTPLISRPGNSPVHDTRSPR